MCSKSHLSSSVKNDSTNFLTLSKLFAKFDFTNQISQRSHFFVSITLRMEVTVNITPQSSIIIACFNHVAHKHSSKKVKCVLTV